ncbi:conjugal transfer protein [Ruminococcus sp. AM22-13]|nr:conjugal transfer protein [Ruminococcus sp. AM22-13]
MIFMNQTKEKIEWLLCPICSNKTRLKVRKDTELINFPLFCPKCKKESLINVNNLKETIVKEPDAKTQSR